MRLQKALLWVIALFALVVLGLPVDTTAAKARSGKASRTHSPSLKTASMRSPSGTVKRVSASSTRRSKKSARSARERGQKAPSADRITEIQQALAKDGSFTSKSNGKWDANTIEAMKKFQVRHGLNPTGKLDARSLQELGLGSKTAGLAPPPPVNSSELRPSLSQSNIRRQ